MSEPLAWLLAGAMAGSRGGSPARGGSPGAGAKEGREREGKDGKEGKEGKEGKDGAATVRRRSRLGRPKSSNGFGPLVHGASSSVLPLHASVLTA